MSAKPAVWCPLEPPERECAFEAIVSAGLDTAEFVLEEKCNEVYFPGGAEHTYKLVSVKRLVQGSHRQYNTGPGGSWPFEFERDLQLGMYGAARGDAKKVTAPESAAPA